MVGAVLKKKKQKKICFSITASQKQDRFWSVSPNINKLGKRQLIKIPFLRIIQSSHCGAAEMNLTRIHEVADLMTDLS